MGRPHGSRHLYDVLISRQVGPVCFRSGLLACWLLVSSAIASAQTLEEIDELDNTILIVTADHGDMLGERGLWYKMNFFEHSARVPLVMAGPGVKQGVAKNACSLIDLLPTFIEIGREHRHIPGVAHEPGFRRRPARTAGLRKNGAFNSPQDGAVRIGAHRIFSLLWRNGLSLQIVVFDPSTAIEIRVWLASHNWDIGTDLMSGRPLSRFGNFLNLTDRYRHLARPSVA